MATSDEKTTQELIEEAARSPKSTTIDGTTVTNPSIPELIEADRHLSGNTLAKGRRRGLSLAKLKPPGTA